MSDSTPIVIPWEPNSLVGNNVNPETWNPATNKYSYMTQDHSITTGDYRIPGNPSSSSTWHTEKGMISTYVPEDTFLIQMKIYSLSGWTKQVIHPWDSTTTSTKWNTRNWPTPSLQFQMWEYATTHDPSTYNKEVIKRLAKSTLRMKEAPETDESFLDKWKREEDFDSGKIAIPLSAQEEILEEELPFLKGLRNRAQKNPYPERPLLDIYRELDVSYTKDQNGTVKINPIHYEDLQFRIDFLHSLLINCQATPKDMAELRTLRRQHPHLTEKLTSIPTSRMRNLQRNTHLMPSPITILDEKAETQEETQQREQTEDKTEGYTILDQPSNPSPETFYIKIEDTYMQQAERILGMKKSHINHFLKTGYGKISP
jgi:hypothetical protein